MPNMLSYDLGAYLDFAELGNEPPVTYVMNKMTGYRQPLYRELGASVRIPKGCPLPKRYAQLALAVAKCLEHLQLSGGSMLTLEEYKKLYPKITVEEACQVTKGFSLFKTWYRIRRLLKQPSLQNALIVVRAKTMNGWAQIFGRSADDIQQEYHAVWAWYCREVVSRESKSALHLLDAAIKEFFPDQA